MGAISTKRIRFVYERIASAPAAPNMLNKPQTTIAAAAAHQYVLRISMTELYVKLRIEQFVASQHLAILRSAGFVKTEREREQISYSLD